MNFFRDKIYVSIASFMDLELGFTVYDMLEKATYPKRLFVSIFDQDRFHVNLEGVFERFGVNSYVHKKIDYLDAKGVGYARYQAERFIKPMHKYFLQIDSHMRFEEGWDEDLIKDYEMQNIIWDNHIMSTYPQPYERGEGIEILFQNPDKSNKVKLKPVDAIYKFEAVYDDYVEDIFGEETGYFCGGFVFGYTDLVPRNNPQIYFNGEEQMLSLRAYENGTKIIAPHKNYVYHDYEGNKRKRHWEKIDSSKLEELGRKTTESFFDFTLGQPYGIRQETYDDYVKKFLSD